MTEKETVSAKIAAQREKSPAGFFFPHPIPTKEMEKDPAAAQSQKGDGQNGEHEVVGQQYGKETGQGDLKGDQAEGNQKNSRQQWPQTPHKGSLFQIPSG